MALTAKKKAGSVKVEQRDGEKPVEKKVLAQSIVAMSAALNDLNRNGLNRRAIMVLIQHKTKESMSAIESILDALQTLQRDYTNL